MRVPEDMMFPIHDVFTLDQSFLIQGKNRFGSCSCEEGPTVKKGMSVNYFYYRLNSPQREKK